MTENFKDSFLKVISDRFANPFLFNFMVSWCFLNYEFFLIVGFGKDADKVIGKLHRLTFNGDPAVYGIPHWVFNCFVLPMVASLIYLILMPFVHRWIYVYQRWHAVTIKSLALKWNSLTPISPDEYVRKVEEVRELNQRLGTLSEANDTLQGRVRVLSDELSERDKHKDSPESIELKNKLSKLRLSYNENGVESFYHDDNLLQELAKRLSSGDVDLNSISSAHLDDLNKLMSVGLVSVSNNTVRLTDLGRRYFRPSKTIEKDM